MTNAAALQSKDVTEKLGLHENIARRLILRVVGVLLAIAVVCVALVVYRNGKDAAAVVRYTTQQVTRGHLVETVSATGTLAPVNVVEVGSEVSGTMKTVEVDYNDRVKIGQVLARIDKSKLAGQVLQSEAALESARAKVLETDGLFTEVTTRPAASTGSWEWISAD